MEKEHIKIRIDESGKEIRYFMSSAILPSKKFISKNTIEGKSKGQDKKYKNKFIKFLKLIFSKK